jgi:hypothetical protein
VNAKLTAPESPAKWVTACQVESRILSRITSKANCTHIPSFGNNPRGAVPAAIPSMTALLTPDRRASGSNESHNTLLPRSFATANATVNLIPASRSPCETISSKSAILVANLGLENNAR